jgi:hypothetical protein
MDHSLKDDFFNEWRTRHQEVCQDEIGVKLESGCTDEHSTYGCVVGLTVVKDDIDTTVLQGLQMLPCSGQIISEDELGLFCLRFGTNRLQLLEVFVLEVDQ